MSFSTDSRRHEDFYLKKDLESQFPCPGRESATHADLSGGKYKVKSGEEGKFFRMLDNHYEKGAWARLSERRRTDVGTVFVDIDYEVGKGSQWLNPTMFETVLKRSVLPTIKSFFPSAEPEAWGRVHFAICVPELVQQSKGLPQVHKAEDGRLYRVGKSDTNKIKFGCHIRALQTRDEEGIRQGVFLHTQNLLLFRTQLAASLERELETADFDWDDALDRSPMQSGGMRMLHNRKCRIKCACDKDPCCKVCFGQGAYEDMSFYNVFKVYNAADGKKDDEYTELLQGNRQKCWARTSISTEFDAPRGTPAGNIPQLAQDAADSEMGLGSCEPPVGVSMDHCDFEALKEWYETCDTAHGPEQGKTKSKKGPKWVLKKGSSEVKMYEKTEGYQLDKKVQNFFNKFIHAAFPHYVAGEDDKKTWRDKVHVKQIRKCEGGRRFFVSLEGENAKRCLNRRPTKDETKKFPNKRDVEFPHNDNTYLEIHEGTIYQRCHSGNTGMRCKGLSCKKFRSKGVQLHGHPVLQKVFCVPSKKRKAPATTSNLKGATYLAKRRSNRSSLFL